MNKLLSRVRCAVPAPALIGVKARELRDSERRLKAAQLFEDKPQMGISPRIVVRPPGSRDDEAWLASDPDPDDEDIPR